MLRFRPSIFTMGSARLYQDFAKVTGIRTIRWKPLALDWPGPRCCT